MPRVEDVAPEERSGAVRLLGRLEKGVARWPLARLSTVGPRTLRWALELAEGEADRVPGVPTARATASLAAQVAMDEAIMALFQGPERFPRRADYERVGAELAVAREHFADQGWLDDPRSYHRDPDPLELVRSSRGWALGQRYERIRWQSGYRPRADEPGAARWQGYEHNHTASAWVLEHAEGSRPWMLAVHGFGTGYAATDLLAFRAPHVHHDLGWNVAGIVLPVHGHRRSSRIAGEDFIGFDLMNTVHALAQAVWDIRRLLSWIRARDPQAVVLQGVSLGGYVVSLASCLDDDLDAVIAGIPVCDLPELFALLAPRHVQARARQHGILQGNAELVHRVVSPLAMPSLVPPERRYVFAGLGDRMAVPEQARMLWEHWDRPSIRWYPGNHVGYLWSDKVADFVDAALAEVAAVPISRR